jgi:hypothetical protein
MRMNVKMSFKPKKRKTFYYFSSLSFLNEGLHLLMQTTREREREK